MVGVAGFEPAASSSRTQVAVRTARAVVRLIWERPSVNIRQRPATNVPVVTQLVTRLAGSRSGVGPCLARGQVISRLQNTRWPLETIAELGDAVTDPSAGISSGRVLLWPASVVKISQRRPGEAA
jgi:hypothetical protein